jgi:hypothetical protein
MDIRLDGLGIQGLSLVACPTKSVVRSPACDASWAAVVTGF